MAEDQDVASIAKSDRPQTDGNVGAKSPTVAELLEESAALTRALTGLTCGGSEFFVRKGDRYVADIDACVAWVRRRDTNAHKMIIDAISARKEAEAALSLARGERSEP